MPYPILSSLVSKYYSSSLLLKTTVRSSRSQMFFKIGVIKDFVIFTEKNTCVGTSLFKGDSNTGIFL